MKSSVEREGLGNGDDTGEGLETTVWTWSRGNGDDSGDLGAGE